MYFSCFELFIIDKKINKEKEEREGTEIEN